MSKYIIVYQSPNTDEPNKKLVSVEYSLKEILYMDAGYFGFPSQIDFTDGGYLRLDELEPEYTKIMDSYEYEPLHL